MAETFGNINVVSKLSAQPCGCDEGAGWVCTSHSILPTEPWQRARLALAQWNPQPGQKTYTPGPVVNTPTTDAQWRKQRPVYSGVLAYFPDALLEVAHVSWLGNEQHNPGQPLHWSRDKSADHLDCIGRHLVDHSVNPIDKDGALHLAKAAWRALAALQLYKEGKLK
jgi:hypothetical protein